MICDDPFYTGICPARTEDGRCVSKYHCSHKVEPPKPPTNADRIRAMSDEELASLLTDYSNNGGWVTETGRKVCYDRIIEWLQQPAEED